VPKIPFFYRYKIYSKNFRIWQFSSSIPRVDSWPESGRIPAGNKIKINIALNVLLTQISYFLNQILLNRIIKKVFKVLHKNYLIIALSIGAWTDHKKRLLFI
jgi:hypothetical protein